MKRYLSISAVFATGLALGIAIATSHVGYKAENKSEATDDKQPLYWVAPMDKNYRRDGPGQSPMGMDLVPVYQEDGTEKGSNTIKISSAVENNLSVKVSTVNKESLAIPISTFGMVQYDESRVTHVHSRVEGWIERLGIAASGDKVSKGQTLFELYSPSLVSSQEEYLAAKRSGNKTLIKASSARLLSLGLTQTQISALAKRGSVEQTISIIADADGVVIDLNVRKGMYIKPATEVLSFGTLDSVWVIGQILERQSGLVKQGQTVEIKVSALPGKTWEGSVNYVYPELDLKTRTQAIRVRVLNQDRALKPNMLANIQVLHTATNETLTVPRNALIKGANHHRVVRALGSGRYESTLVDIGFEGLSLAARSSDSVDVGSIDKRRVQIISGLSEGDMVVTSAQFLIDSESNVGADLKRMQASTEGGAINAVEENAKQVADNVRVMASGKVERVMPAMRMIKITHDPIPEWDWPEMTMDFSLSDDLDLSEFETGSIIHFELVKQGDWEFEISAVEPSTQKLKEDVLPDTNDHDMAPDLIDHQHMDHHHTNGAVQ